MENENQFDDPVVQAVKELFGMDYLFPYQRLVIGNILEAAQAAGIPLRQQYRAPAVEQANEQFREKNEGENGGKTEEEDRASIGRQIVILPTGAGKSLCFQLPAMMLEGPTLVIYPILSLMADQERRLAEKGFAPVILRGAQTEEERNLIWQKLRSGESRFIIANPEVLLTPKVLKILGELGIVHVVIDEAHCVSEWGESFRPSYLEIHRIIEASGAPLVTAFTATASALVLEKIEFFCFPSYDSGNDNDRVGGGGSSSGSPGYDSGNGNYRDVRSGRGGAHKIIGNPDRNNISYAARGCILRDIAVRDLLFVNETPAIVFCSSRPGTEKLSRYLRNALGTNEIRFYHAGLEREEKTEVEKWFFSSENGILVSTCAYGMGVDKPNIRTVIHRDCPPSVEAYLQESGRAGRDGAFSRAILLWGPDDEAACKRARTDSDRQRLSDLFAFARDAAHCRREALLSLLNYEGEQSKPEGECCDVCSARASPELREEEPVLSFFRKNRRAYRADEASTALACAIVRAQKQDWTSRDAQNAIRYLIKVGKLTEIKHFPWKNHIDVGKKFFSSPSTRAEKRDLQ
ncbi:MAG: DEAD/DEAH box helicase [Spirochaetaceae bacterium]|jgi:ATP-dependent DNA helicase RecQ|nr:DEAD/DEAH box helicase [Spirochaetaceae bacterium]